MANYDLCPTCRGGVSAEKVSEATCTSPAIYKDVCGELCGWESDPYKSGDPKPHAYGGWTITKTPDCTNKGSHYKTCKNCGDKVTEDIDALGHDWGYYKTLQEATCTEKGATVYACKRCDEPKKDSYVTTDPLDHELLTEGDDPTCTENGYKRETCQRDGCDYSKTTILYTSGHSVSSWAYVGPTCTTDAHYEGYCSTCKTTVTKDKQEGTAEHTGLTSYGYKEATCTEAGANAGMMCTDCNTIITEPTEVAPLGHKEKSVSGKSATCTEAGYKASTVCERCKETLSGGETIPATGHNMQATEVVSATCQSGGYTIRGCINPNCTETDKIDKTDPIAHNYATWIETVSPATCKALEVNKYKCTMCDKTETRPEGSYGDHVVKDNAWQYEGPTCTTDGYYYGTCSECRTTVQGSVDEGSAAHPQASLEDIPAVAATCSKKGSTWGQKCTTCGETIVQPVEIAKDPSNHKAIPVLGKNATCTESGLTEGTKCEWCGTPIEVQEEIPASGHAWDKGKITTPPTATTDGVKTYTCSNCSGTYTEIIPATGGGDTKIYYSVTTNHYAKINGIDTFLEQDIFSLEAETEVNPENYIKTYDKYEYNGNCSMTDPQLITENLTIDYYYQMKVASDSYTIEVGKTISIDYDDSLPSIEVSVPDCVEYQLDSSVIMITGKKVGSGTITLTTSGEKFAEYNITVEAAAITKYTLTFQHKDADTQVIIWSNTSVSLDKNTFVTAATLDRNAEQIDNYTYQPSTIGSFTLLGDTKVDLYYKKDAEAPTYTISFKYINQDNVEIYTRDPIKSGSTTITPSTYAIDTIDYNNGKYRLVSTSPEAPFTLSADTTITYTYRGYYSATIRYINIKSGTSIKQEEIQYLSKQSFMLPASAPEISGYKALNYVIVNEDRQEALSENKVISLENIDNYIDYQYTTSGIVVEYRDAFTKNLIKTDEPIETSETTYTIPNLRDNIIEQNYRIHDVAFNGETDSDKTFGSTITLSTTGNNIITYLCYPLFRYFENSTIKTGDKINIWYDQLRSPGEKPIISIENIQFIIIKSNSDGNITLFGTDQGNSDVTITFCKISKTYTYDVSYKNSPQNISLSIGVEATLNYQKSLHTLQHNYGTDLCAEIDDSDDYYKLRGIKKQIVKQTIYVLDNKENYIITALYIHCDDNPQKITYFYKNIEGNEIKSSRSETLPKGTPIVISLKDAQYYISGYKLVAIEKNSEGKQYSDIDITLEEETTITLWYETTTHTHNYNRYVETVAPSCTTQGYELWSCSCEETQQKEIKKALGHDLPLEWTITIEPTETTSGQKTRTCKRCGIKESQILLALGILTEDIDQITLRSNKKSYSPTTTYDMIIVSKTNNDKLINVGAAAPSTLSEGSIYIEGGISVKSNLNSGWLRRTKDSTNRRISPKTTVDLIVLNQNNTQAFIVRSSAPTGTPGPAGTLYFVTGE